MSLLCRSSTWACPVKDKVVVLPVILQDWDLVQTVQVVEFRSCSSGQGVDVPVGVLLGPDRGVPAPQIMEFIVEVIHLVLCFWEQIVVCQRHSS